MKFYKLLAGFGLAVLASVSVNASAQTSVCTWNSVYGSSDSYGNSSVSFICRISTGAVVASRQDTRYSWQSTYNCGTASIMAGYKKTGATQGSYYPAMCNDVIVVDNTPPVVIPQPVVVFPGASCSWVATPSYYGYNYFDFVCANHGVVAKKTMGYPWSYSSSGYSCKISPVAPYKVESWTNNTSCDVTKVTK